MTGADLQTVRSYFAEAVPFAGEMGFSVDEVGHARAMVRFTYDDRWSRPGQIINGGTLMALPTSPCTPRSSAGSVWCRSR